MLPFLAPTGLLTEKERQIFDRVTPLGKKTYYLPMIWAGMTVTKAKEEGLMDEWQWQGCMDGLNQFRAKCGQSLMVSVQNVPLVYSQVYRLKFKFEIKCLKVKLRSVSPNISLFK
jgi:hypothetical protein